MTDTNISLILDDFVSSSAESSSPEKVLFLAVILQAVLDSSAESSSPESIVSSCNLTSSIRRN